MTEQERLDQQYLYGNMSYYGYCQYSKLLKEERARQFRESVQLAREEEAYRKRRGY